MSEQGSVIAVHPYPQYVDEESFRDTGAKLTDEFPVYGVEASNYNEESLIGDFYEDTLSEVENGRNGAIPEGELEDVEPPFYFIGGLLHDCVPGGMESVMLSGYEAYLVEDASFEKFDGDEFSTYSEMENSNKDYSDLFQNLYMLGVETVELDDLV